MITKDMTIMSIIEKNEAVVPVLLNSGMHCLGCIMAHGESLEQACAVHGIDVDALVEEINNVLAAEPVEA